MDATCAETPLVELLRAVPVDFVYKHDTPNPLGVDTSHIPVGWHCHAAANEIERLRAAIRQTLEENGHVADGDVCTLKVLKDALLAH